MSNKGGQIGNTNARKENRIWGDTIKRVVTQGNSKRLRAAAEKLVDEAEAGNVNALRELGDRLDGKPHQSIDATIDGSLTVEVLKFSDADKAAR